jgi:hypothetical protein
MFSQGIMSGRKGNNSPGLCPVKEQHRLWWLTFRIYPIPPILMMEAGFFSETLTSSYGVWYCRWLQSVTCCHLYHRQNPQQPQFKPEWFQGIIQLVMHKFHSWPSYYSSADRIGHFVGATDVDAKPWWALWLRSTSECSYSMATDTWRLQ